MDNLNFKIADQELAVYNLSWGVSQPETGGRACGQPTVRRTTLALSSIDDPVLLDWAQGRGKEMDVTINYYENGAVVRTLTFTKAVAISFSQECEFVVAANGTGGSAVVRDFVTFVCDTANYQDVEIENP